MVPLVATARPTPTFSSFEVKLGSLAMLLAMRQSSLIWSAGKPSSLAWKFAWSVDWPLAISSLLSWALATPLAATLYRLSGGHQSEVQPLPSDKASYGDILLSVNVER